MFSYLKLRVSHLVEKHKTHRLPKVMSEKKIVILQTAINNKQPKGVFYFFVNTILITLNKNTVVF